MWEKYLKMIGEVDEAIAVQMRSMKKTTVLPPLPPLPPRKHVRGRRPHDPKFDVRMAL